MSLINIHIFVWKIARESSIHWVFVSMWSTKREFTKHPWFMVSWKLKWSLCSNDVVGVNFISNSSVGNMINTRAVENILKWWTREMQNVATVLLFLLLTKPYTHTKDISHSNNIIQISWQSMGCFTVACAMHLFCISIIHCPILEISGTDEYTKYLVNEVS